jgi:hypothetical protein
LTLPRVKSGEPYETDFYLRAEPGRILKVEGVKCDAAYLDTTFAPNATDSSIRFTVRLKPDIPYGPFNTVLHIRTSDPAAPTRRIPVSGYVLRRVEARPGRVAFGIVAPGEDKVEVVELFSPYGDAVKVDRVISDPSSRLDWRLVDPSPGGGSVRVELRLKKSAAVDLRREPASPPGVIEEGLRVLARAGGVNVATDVSVSALVR